MRWREAKDERDLARLRRVSEAALIEQLAAIHKTKEIAKMSYCGSCTMPAPQCRCGSGGGGHKVYPFPLPRMMNDWSFMGLTQLAGAMGLYNRYVSDFTQWYVDMVCPGYRDQYECCDRKQMNWAPATGGDLVVKFRIKNTTPEFLKPVFGVRVTDASSATVDEVKLGGGPNNISVTKHDGNAIDELAPDASETYHVTIPAAALQVLEEDSTYSMLVHVRVGTQLVRCTVVEIKVGDCTDPCDRALVDAINAVKDQLP